MNNKLIETPDPAAYIEESELDEMVKLEVVDYIFCDVLRKYEDRRTVIRNVKYMVREVIGAL